MKYWETALAILAALFASLAFAEDFKTIKGKEYKNAKVSGVELDGIMLTTTSEISKAYFTELPKEVQDRFHYDPAKAAAYSAKQNAALEQLRKQQEKAQQQAKADVPDIAQLKQRGFDVQTAQRIRTSCNSIADSPAGIQRIQRRNAQPGFHVSAIDSK